MTGTGLSGRIAARAGAAGVPVGCALSDSLARYVELLVRWNERMNLTGLTDDDAGLDRLVVEPLGAVRRLGTGALRLIDIGSGGGSPAVPMKLARPDVRLRMVESKSRKAAFLREVVRHLGICGAEVEACRYEQLAARVTDDERADVVTVRAVRLDEDGFDCLSRLLARGGRLFLFEGEGGDGGAGLGGRFSTVQTYRLVESLKSRLVVLSLGDEQKA
ncbi:MAG TPA: 16S rRNA (guanine(527)-N(7))-methyltransferase RsmG [Acidobacteria bacterium]|nr:16S rRNA (guanine(527)-N(7))-methyltransferase RsmG [Acidobacteriota bacterium]